ncbi:MAG TPA: c-type cytochrome [Anaerolineales bacterium]|nr:c-type cytochrome [Anaerolineales bacterium]
MTWRVIVSSLLALASIVMLAIVAVNEPARMKKFDEGYQARSIEAGAAIFHANCISCHGENGEGGIAPTLNRADLFDPNGRIKEVGWNGTVENFIYTTISGGRPLSFLTYQNNKMPTWSQEYGGPLRIDEVRNVTAYVMNYAKNWEVKEGEATPVPTIDAVGDSITESALPAGDPVRGEELVTKLGCLGCHQTAGGAGPAWFADQTANGEGIGTRAGNRFGEAGYTGAATTAEEYLRESIVQPNANVVNKEDGTPYIAGVMPQNYGTERLEAQDLADIIAYLLTLK